MFNEVDTDGDKSVTLEEWKNFWVNVLSQKGDDGKALYSVEDGEAADALFSVCLLLFLLVV